VPTPKDEKIENLVSLITQNILDKEEQYSVPLFKTAILGELGGF